METRLEVLAAVTILRFIAPMTLDQARYPFRTIDAIIYRINWNQYDF